MLVMRALATTLAGLTVAAGVITAPFEQQLRTVARVQDGARNVADVTFDVTYSKGRQRRHTLKFADIALSPKARYSTPHQGRFAHPRSSHAALQPFRCFTQSVPPPRYGVGSALRPLSPAVHASASRTPSLSFCRTSAPRGREPEQNQY